MKPKTSLVTLKIVDVKRGVNSNGRLSAVVYFNSDEKNYFHEFLYTDTEDIIKYARLWKYCGMNSDDQIIGKEIRGFVTPWSIKGIGPLDKDVILPLFLSEFKEVSAEEFLQLL